MRTSRGFTLIELAVTMLVVALAAAVVAPSMGRSLESLRLRSEVAGVTSFLRAARERAITRRDIVEVMVDEEGHALVLRPGDGRPRVDEPGAVRRLTTMRIEADPPSAPALTFLAHGASTGGRFRLEAPGPVVYTVTVEPFTGRVTARRSES
jgi:type II secretion system protein H